MSKIKMSHAFCRKTVFSLALFKRSFRVKQVENALTQNYHGRTNISKWYFFSSRQKSFTITGTFIVGATAYYLLSKQKQSKTPSFRAAFVLSAATDESDAPDVEMTLKKLKFEEYASYEYGGKSLMTPQDFLNSLVDNKKENLERRKKKLTTQDVEKILKYVHRLSADQEDLFANMGENGIITYPEYLFLLTLLTKSSRGLDVAFRMLDLDGNATLGKAEFQELEKMINRKTRHSLDETDVALQNTSLLLYFFGKSGKGQLTFSDMLRFTRNLQREFWRLEFRLFSKNHDVMNSEHFAELLLQSTRLDDSDVQEYLQRLKSRRQQDIEVHLTDYTKFGEFLNNLQEFSIALKIYNVANQPVTQEEFKRAVLIATGNALGDHIVNTVFQLFDIDGDGKLSQKEFLGLMKDRVSKRFAAKNETSGVWDEFISCVKSEVVD